MIYNPLALGLQQFAPQDDEDELAIRQQQQVSPQLLEALQRARMAQRPAPIAAAPPPAPEEMPQNDPRIVGAMVGAAQAGAAPAMAPPAPDEEQVARYARAGVSFNPATGPMQVRTLRGSNAGLALLGGTPEERTAAFTGASIPDRQAMLYEQMHGQMATEPQLANLQRGRYGTTSASFRSPQEVNQALLQGIMQTATAPDELAAKEFQRRGGMTSEERALQQKRISAEAQAHDKTNPARSAAGYQKLAEIDDELTALQTGKTKAQVRAESIQESMLPTSGALAAAASQKSKELYDKGLSTEGAKGTSTEGFLQALAGLYNIPEPALAKSVGEHAAILTPSEIEKVKQKINAPIGTIEKLLVKAQLGASPPSAVLNEYITRRERENYMTNQMIRRLELMRSQQGQQQVSQ